MLVVDDRTFYGEIRTSRRFFVSSMKRTVTYLLLLLAVASAALDCANINNTTRYLGQDLIGCYK